MAGSEKTGMETARTDLYTGLFTAITPGDGAPASAVAAVSGLWSGVGAKVCTIGPGCP